ncbi:protein IQ-DOMAIN 6-like [Pyrus communis]|uniref:protein IQ-DOMAIN 6-like n=1 Tax=Pyrus communis TaxID=23211 RepID=UPI0035C1AF1E
MGTTRKWFRTIRRKLVGSSNRDIVVVYTNTTPSTHNESAPRYEKIDGIASSSSSFVASSPSAFERRIFTKEDIAAIRLQAFFRGHLARQAFRALRSLVKLQALVRGVCVRKQARIALYCMHSMVRLQVKVRARQLLSGSTDGRSIAG